MIRTKLICGFTLGVALSLPMLSAAQQGDSDTARLIERIVQDVVDYNLERARGEIREHTGIDPLRRGFEWDRDYHPVAGRLPEERRSELGHLSAEYDREMGQIERELERELSQARQEFEREAAREERRDKIAEKRRKLEKKVDDAYGRFREKAREANRRYDERRSDLIAYDE